MLIETSEMLPSASEVAWILRAMGERGLLAGRRRGPRGSTHPPPRWRTAGMPRQGPASRAEQCDAVVETVGRYNPEAVICVGVPFGHTRPQWIVPHGGTMTLDGASHRITASYA